MSKFATYIVNLPQNMEHLILLSMELSNLAFKKISQVSNFSLPL